MKAEELARLRRAANVRPIVDCLRDVRNRLQEFLAMPDQIHPRDPDRALLEHEALRAKRAEKYIPVWLEKFDRHIAEISAAKADQRIAREHSAIAELEAALQFLIDTDGAPAKPLSESASPTLAAVDAAYVGARSTNEAADAARRVLAFGLRYDGHAARAWWNALVEMVREGEHIPGAERIPFADAMEWVAAGGDVRHALVDKVDGRPPVAMDGSDLSGADESESQRKQQLREYDQYVADSTLLYVAQLRERGIAYVGGDWLPTVSDLAKPNRGAPTKVKSARSLWKSLAVHTGKFGNSAAAEQYIRRLEAHFVAEYSRLKK